YRTRVLFPTFFEDLMTRILTAAVVAALFAIPALRADDAKSGDVKSNRLDQAKVFAEFPKQMQAFQLKFAKATPEERKELVKDRPNPQPLTEKANKLSESD